MLVPVLSKKQLESHMLAQQRKFFKMQNFKTQLHGEMGDQTTLKIVKLQMVSLEVDGAPLAENLEDFPTIQWEGTFLIRRK